MRDIQKFSFNDWQTYYGWSQYNRQKQNGIKEVGLHVNDDDGKIVVEYIKLF